MRRRFEVQISPKGGEARDFLRWAAAQRTVVNFGKADADVHIVAVDVRGEVAGLPHIPEPVRSLVLKGPQQDIQVLRLVLPEQVEKGVRRHLVRSQ